MASGAGAAPQAARRIPAATQSKVRNADFRRAGVPKRRRLGTDAARISQIILASARLTAVKNPARNTSRLQRYPR